MAEKTEVEAEAAAEKAYAAAAEALSTKASPSEAAPPQATGTPTTGTSAQSARAKPSAAASAEAAVPEVEFPSKAKRTPNPTPEAASGSALTLPLESPAATRKAKSSPLPAALNASAVHRTPVKKALKKPAASKQAILPATTAAKAVKIVPTKAAAPTIAAPKTVFQQLKEKTMDTTQFTTKMKSAVGEAQVKAKEAFDKGAATFGEYNEFTKGNLEAVVASGKILASGMQSLGSTAVADGKSAFETLTAEVKELAAVRSPADFFKLQGEFLRRNFDMAVANTSKNSEAVLKLASDVAAPISARVNLAVEKVKQTA
jgi:phasin family protein